jgi:sugar phosphate isomerase/epimerase
MQPLRWAAASRCWNVPLPELLNDAAQLHLEGLQIDVRDELPPTALSDSGRRDFLHRLRERDLQVASTWVPLRHPLYATYELERRVAFLREAMTFTAQLKSSILCLRCGKIPAELEKGDGQTLREILSDLAAHGNHVGVTLALTPTVETAAELLPILNAITTGPLGIDFDPAHCALVGESTIESLRTLHAHVVHVQLRDGVRHLAGGGEETPVGEGIIDWAELLALLGEMDYRGWLTAIRTQGTDKPYDIARGLKHVRKILLGS